MSYLHTSYGHKDIALQTTFTSSTPLAGFLTFSRVARTAVRSRAQQQRVRCRALDRRDPSTIIPNTPTPAARVACAPNPTTHARWSFAARAGRPWPGRRRLEQQHGPGTLYFFMRPGGKPWAVVVGRPDAFFRGSEAF